MENVKVRNDKNIQMKHPTPYSQSWVGMGVLSEPRKAFSAEKSSSKSFNKQKSQAPRKAEQQIQRYSTGLDPTVPHLKYGLFPKKMYISRGQSRIFSTKQSQPTDAQKEGMNSSKKAKNMTNQLDSMKSTIERPAIAKASTIQKFLQNPKAQGESEAPLFVFRPLAQQNLRSLSVSASTHLDIKPKPPRGSILTPLYKRYL